MRPHFERGVRSHFERGRPREEVGISRDYPACVHTLKEDDQERKLSTERGRPREEVGISRDYPACVHTLKEDDQERKWE